MCNCYSNAISLSLSHLAIGGINPFLINPPVSTSVAFNASANLTCIADGKPKVTYQWQKNGQDLSGERGPFLFLSNVVAENRGIYMCRVENSLGVVRSGPAIVNIESNLLSATITTDS